MKLKKNLILASFLAISMFISSTSYAASEGERQVHVDEEALSEMAHKVDRDTIFAEEAPKAPQNEQNSNKQPVQEEPSSEKPNNQTDIIESSEGLNEGGRPLEESQSGEDKPVGNDQGENSSGSDGKNTMDKHPENSENQREDVGYNNPQNPPANKQAINKDNNLSKDPNLNQKEQETSPQNKDFSAITRLENMQKDEEIQREENSHDQAYSYIEDTGSQTGSLKKLTSKENLKSSFTDKRSNLRLNLASTSDSSGTGENSQSQFIIKPQTLIILIAILGAISSAISIALKGKSSKKSD